MKRPMTYTEALQKLQETESEFVSAATIGYRDIKARELKYWYAVKAGDKPLPEVDPCERCGYLTFGDGNRIVNGVCLCLTCRLETCRSPADQLTEAAKRLRGELEK